MTLTKQADPIGTETEDTTSAKGSTSIEGAIPAIFGTPDHRYLGKLYIAAALVFGVFSLVGGVLLSFQQRSLDLFESPERHLAFFATYRVSLLFMFLIPLLVGLAVYIVPRQIGATALVFPRAALGAFWVWLSSAILFLVAWAIDGGLAPRGDQEAVELSLLSLGLLVASTLVITVVLLSTIIVSRAQNMTLWRVPLFTWSMLVAGGVWLLSLPVLFANIITAWVDLRGAGAVHYGLAENLYSQIEWVFDQPQVFIFALPILGIFADISIATEGKRSRHYEMFQILIVLYAILSFGAYSQEFFAPDVSQTPVFVVGTLLQLLVLLLFIGGWLNFSRINKQFKINTPRIISTLAILTLLSGVLIAALRVMGDLLHFFANFNTGSESYQDGLEDFLDPLFDLKGSVIANSVFHTVIVAGLLGAFSALHYWAPQFFSSKLGSLKSIAISLLGFGGLVLWASGDIINGFLEQPENPIAMANFELTDGVRLASILTIVGAVALVVAILAIVAELIKKSMDQTGETKTTEEELSSSNPWNAPTLEWAEPGSSTLVDSAYPLWSSE